MKIEIKRIYDLLEATDGQRILVDRLWPMGISKQQAHLDLWLKDIAPSTELRKAFCHKVGHLLSFQEGYYGELKENPYVNQLRDMAQQQQVTLIYAAKDPKFNHALVLKNYLIG